MKSLLKYAFSMLLLCMLSFQLIAQETFTPQDLLEMKSVRGVQISPDGSEIIYIHYTPRTSNEKPGGSHSEYLRMNLKTKNITPLFGDVKGRSPQWSPDGKYIGFIKKGDNGKNQVFTMPVDGGEISQITNFERNIGSFKWNPNGKGIAFISREVASDKEKELKKRGYGFIFFEENLKMNRLYTASLDGKIKELTTEKNVWNFEFNAQGTQIAATISPEPLIDQNYMFREIYIIDLASGTNERLFENIGKLGNYSFSPDGSKLLYTGAENKNDHAVSQLYVVDLATKKRINLTKRDFKGHIQWGYWKNNKEILFKSGEGVYPKLSLISANGGEREIILDSKDNGIIFGTPSISADFKTFAFTASTTIDPGNIYVWNGKKDIEQITDVNPQLANKTLAKQELIRYPARDGVMIEGLLMYPVGYKANEKYPLVVYVHGGPESHHSNGWLSRYSTPGQVMANKGYMVVYLNYRASTGYGVDFGAVGLKDPAGIEFDDIADAIDYLVAKKGADKERVGMAGGSYGGYASAWFATYYTDYVKAVCAFVGITNVISKKGTTDIPHEERLVHSVNYLEQQWLMNLERSPIYWAHQSKTATLIYGGAEDTRVHPTQSMELHRRMKMNNHPAVRLVQYPGEGHGNRKQVGQIDVLFRQIEWLDWYVKDLKPLDGPMPRLDISERYGLDWNF